MFKRVIAIVLDGVGIGAAPDAAAYGDEQAATLQHTASAVGGLNLPVLESLGLGCIASIEGVKAVARPRAWWGKMTECSAGKDSVTGHWELAGIVQDQPFSTWPDGFPEEIISAFTEVSGYQPLGNVAADGTGILTELGEEHLRSGRPIVYTSCDSVFQVAAHEEIIPLETLYDICLRTHQVVAPWRICRVIARPFLGEDAGSFFRAPGRHDFTLQPPRPNMLSQLYDAGLDVYAVGKIKDLFSGRGITDCYETHNNSEGMAGTLQALDVVETGFVMTNLVDFDMIYGHRRDASGFAAALQEFDHWLPRLLERLNADDLLLITADHGCDPTAAGTDHTREYVPLLAYSEGTGAPGCLGVRGCFADVGASVCDVFSVPLDTGRSFVPTILSA